MDAENWRVPVVYGLMRTVLIRSAGILCHILVPVGIVVLPVGEPVLFGIRIHRLEVEGTIVGDEALEALVVVTCQIVYGEASE